MGGAEFGVRESLVDFIRGLELFVAAVPDGPYLTPMKRKLGRDVKRIRELLVEQRAPRFAILGRRGAGKSTLINAIFGERVAAVGSVEAETALGTWYEYTGALGTLRLLDSRGAQEGASTSPGKTEDAAFASIRAALKQEQPDALLFLCKAKEVDAAIGPDLRFLNQVYQECHRIWDYGPPVVGLVTQVDELDPPDLRDPDEFDEPEKRQNIDHATEVLRRHLAASSLPPASILGVMPVNAYIGFRADGSLRVDHRWQVEALVELLSTHLHESAQLQFARLSQVRRLQRKIANRVVASCATIAGGVGLIPIPLADLAPLTAMQFTMIAVIAYVGGREMNLRTAREFAAALGLNVGSGFVFREASRQLLKVVPGLGTVGAAAIAAGGTVALGKAAIAYFIEEASMERASSVYRHAQRKPAPDARTGLENGSWPAAD
jgi:uncharacterized protein (DUF697 family)/predicted GTPase